MMPMNEIVIVSGLPRSGTSMMMQILEAGGLEILTDNIRTTDLDNQKGYYELEIVKQLPEETSFLKEAQGKVVKIISELVTYLPDDYHYKIVFMRRTISEVLASQKIMLERRGNPVNAISDEEMAALFQASLNNVLRFLEGKKNFDVLFVDYKTVIEDPETVFSQLNTFLEDRLSLEKMRQVPDSKYYRNRS
ncbi:MAG: sulfotransferase family protein [Desulfuromonas sp.]|nr:MAG: sulfotransferase family protein [Desulfuromonas sp.]